MTPANPDALVEKLAQAIYLSLHPGGSFEMARAGRSPSWMAADALAEQIASDLIAPLLADLQQQAASISSLEESVNSLEADLQRVTAERDLSHRTNDLLRAGLANSGGPCLYCTLPREEWTKCEHGFPGCGRADDAMLCPHFGAEMESHDRADAAEARAAQLQAEVEALKGALTEIRDHPESYKDRQLSYGVGWAFFNVQRIARTALAARAATAREGQADG